MRRIYLMNQGRDVILWDAFARYPVSGFSQYRFAGKQRWTKQAKLFFRPGMVAVAFVKQGHEQARICDARDRSESAPRSLR